jgi:hypothetical protein
MPKINLGGDLEFMNEIQPQNLKTICVLGGTSPETPSPIKRRGRSTRRSRRRMAQAIA